MDKKIDVFISYSSIDSKLGNALCNYLEQKKLKCWIAPRDVNVNAGQNYAQCIIDGIKSSKLMVIIFSKHANESEYVLKEVDRAIKYKINVIPFRIDNTEYSNDYEFYLGSVHYLNANVGKPEDYFDLLYHSCNKLLGKKGPIYSGRNPKIILRAKLISLIFLVILAGIGIYIGWNKLHVFKEGAVYGYKNFFGITRIDAEFDFAENYKNGFAKVGKGSKYTFLNKNAHPISDFIYDDIGPFSDNMALVKKGTEQIMFNSRGFEQVRNDQPFRDESIRKNFPGTIPESVGPSMIDTAKFGYINPEGKVIIDIKYTYLDKFQEGCAIACLNGRYGFIDKLGNKVIDFKYDEATPFNNGIASVTSEGKIIYVDKKGNNLSRDPAFMKQNNIRLNIDSILGMQTIPGKNFKLSSYPVSQDEWDQIMGYRHRSYNAKDRIRMVISMVNPTPVNSITYNDIQYFITRLNLISGKKYRLPTFDEVKYVYEETSWTDLGIGGLNDGYYAVTSTNDDVTQLPVLAYPLDNKLTAKHISTIGDIVGPQINFRICLASKN